MSVGDDIWKRHIDQLRPGSIATTDTNTSERDSIDECPSCQSSLQSSTEILLNTPESSSSIDHEHRYPEREHHPTIKD